jgi:hypothetical protein
MQRVTFRQFLYFDVAQASAYSKRDGHDHKATTVTVNYGNMTDRCTQTGMPKRHSDEKSLLAAD